MIGFVNLMTMLIMQSSMESYDAILFVKGKMGHKLFLSYRFEKNTNNWGYLGDLMNLDNKLDEVIQFTGM